jgi:hypothetical protein
MALNNDLSYRRIFDEDISSYERLKIITHHLEIARKMMERCLNKEHVEPKPDTVYKWRRYNQADPFIKMTPEEVKEKIKHYGDSVKESDCLAGESDGLSN